MIPTNQSLNCNMVGDAKFEYSMIPAFHHDTTFNQATAVTLPNTYIIHENDVLIGSGKQSNHLGNIFFRQLVINYIQEYSNAKGKHGKSYIICSVVQQIKCNGGSFIKRDTKTNQSIIVPDCNAVSSTMGITHEQISYKTSH